MITVALAIAVVFLSTYSAFATFFIIFSEKSNRETTVSRNELFEEVLMLRGAHARYKVRLRCRGLDIDQINDPVDEL